MVSGARNLRSGTPAPGWSGDATSYEVYKTFNPLVYADEMAEWHLVKQTAETRLAELSILRDQAQGQRKLAAERFSAAAVLM